MIDRGDLALIATIIRNHHIALAVRLFGPAAAEPDTLRRLIDEGFLSLRELEAAGQAGVLGEAYASGVSLVRNPEGDGEPVELSAWEERMASAARARGAQMVVGLGERMVATTQGITTAMLVEQERWGRDLDEAATEERRKEAIREVIASTIERGDSWRQARGALGEALGDDWTRDLGRIAVTELQNAVNAGYMDAIQDELGPDAKFAVIPNPDACPVCRKSYLGSDGRPKIWEQGELPPPEVNFKVKAKDQVVTIPPRHPNCFCQVVAVEPGWEFDENWVLMPT